MNTVDTKQLREAIGPRADYYLARFEKIERVGGGWVAGWNLAAFFFSTAWFTYRRMDSWATANFFLLVGGAIATAVTQSPVALYAMLVVAFVLIPIYANAIYFRSLMSRLAKADAAKSEFAASKLRRPPSAWSLVSGVLTNVLAFVMTVFFVVGPAAYSDYGPRSRVSEGVALASSLSEELAAFHVSHRRLPGPQEAADFRIKEPMKYTESVVYDADRRMIVVTMRVGYDKGKRIAMHAIEKDGTLTWDCRTIDVEQRYLPGRCRN